MMYQFCFLIITMQIFWSAALPVQQRKTLTGKEGELN